MAILLREHASEESDPASGVVVAAATTYREGVPAPDRLRSTVALSVAPCGIRTGRLNSTLAAPARYRRDQPRMYSGT